MSIKKHAQKFKPKLLLAGYSSYPRHFDYKRMREIADSVGAYFMADIAHISGLVATGNAPNVFDYCDLVTTTTHKTLRGPRGALVFGVRDFKGKDLYKAIEEATSPGLQGENHHHTIAAIAAALHDANTPAFKTYGDNVIKNARAMAESLKKLGYTLFTDGTSNHIVLVNLKDKGIDGGRIEALFNHLGIVINKNTIRGDTNALRPSGIRIGSPAMTTRGATEDDFRQISELIHRGIQMAMKANTFKKPSEYNSHVAELAKSDPETLKLINDVKEFSKKLEFHCLKID